MPSLLVAASMTWTKLESSLAADDDVDTSAASPISFFFFLPPLVLPQSQADRWSHARTHARTHAGERAHML